MQRSGGGSLFHARGPAAAKDRVKKNHNKFGPCPHCIQHPCLSREGATDFTV